MTRRMVDSGSTAEGRVGRVDGYKVDGGGAGEAEEVEAEKIEADSGYMMGAP